MMPELVWNETDFLEYFEVEPSIGDYEEEYHYVVLRLPLRLELAVYPYTGDIYISVFCTSFEKAIIDIVMQNCPGARMVKDQRGNFVEFAAANCFSSRYRRYDGESVIPYGVRLMVNPHIRVELFPG